MDKPMVIYTYVIYLFLLPLNIFLDFVFSNVYAMCVYVCLSFVNYFTCFSL